MVIHPFQLIILLIFFTYMIYHSTEECTGRLVRYKPKFEPAGWKTLIPTEYVKVLNQIDCKFQGSMLCNIMLLRGLCCRLLPFGKIIWQLWKNLLWNRKSDLQNYDRSTCSYTYEMNLLLMLIKNISEVYIKRQDDRLALNLCNISFVRINYTKVMYIIRTPISV